MPRVCTVCTHGDRESIDSGLVAAAPFRRIAAQYGLSENAMRRHAADHLPAHLAQAEAAAEVANADDLLAQVRALQAKSLGLRH